MLSCIQLAGQLKQIVDVLNLYHWKEMGTLYSLSDKIPKLPGVYKFASKNPEQEYIGRAIAKGGLAKRIKSHVARPHKEWCGVEDQKRFSVFVIEMDDSADGRVLASIVEDYLILTERPSINVHGKR